MSNEQTLVVYSLHKHIDQARQEIIEEAKKRKIENSTIITVNYVRNAIHITTNNAAFVQYLLLNTDYKVNPPRM
jgi:hypothetical protein